MKFKTLIDKESKEFIVIISFGEKNPYQTFTSSIPHLLPMSATKEGIIEHYNGFDLLEDIDLIEVELKIIEDEG